MRSFFFAFVLVKTSPSFIGLLQPPFPPGFDKLGEDEQDAQLHGIRFAPAKSKVRSTIATVQGTASGCKRFQTLTLTLILILK